MTSAPCRLRALWLLLLLVTLRAQAARPPARHGKQGAVHKVVHWERSAPPRLGAACDDLDPTALAQAIEREAALLLQLPQEPGLQLGGPAIAPADYARSTLLPLARLARRGRAALCEGLPKKFFFYRDTAAKQGRFTAYHHPVFHGSREKKGPYQHPLYRRPPGALAGLTTAEILAGGLSGQHLELVYLADPTEALDAHIEGSALIILEDGGTVNLTTDGHNGGAYVNVAKMVIADGKIDRTVAAAAPLGMTRVRKYFIDHPDELSYYWSKNPHFVFFRETEARGTGKFGELTPGRSLAVDPRCVPIGAAVWIRGEKPDIVAAKSAGSGRERLRGFVPFSRVALAQDTGAAILGHGRVDVFFGVGPAAQEAASVMSSPGAVYLLLGRPPRPTRHSHTRPSHTGKGARRPSG